MADPLRSLAGLRERVERIVTVSEPAIVAGILVGIATLIMGLFFAIPTVGLALVAVLSGKSAGLTWNPYMYNPKLARRLRRVTAPTLVVWGEDDTFLPLAHGEVYAQLIPGATLQTVPRCGHLVPLEQTEVFIRHVRAFLDV